MVFLGVFMMPFYYGSRARSVPEYLRLRFDEKTRGFNAISFALMTVFSSGISMYAMAKLLQILHIFDAPFRALGLGPQYIFHVCIVSWAIVVLAYVLLGGLSSAIYNEVLQFFLIVAGFLPLVYLGLRDAGGWSGIVATVPPQMTHAWRGFGSAATSPMGVDALGMAMGLGFVLSFGYWCTDFLVVQRAMAADSMAAARRRSTTSWMSCSWCSRSSTRRCWRRFCSGCSGSAPPATARSPASSPAPPRRRCITG